MRDERRLCSRATHLLCEDTHESGKTAHTHGDLAVFTSAICAKLVRIDPSMSLQNAVHDRRNTGDILEPSKALTAVTSVFLSSSRSDQASLSESVHSRSIKQGMANLLRRMRNPHGKRNYRLKDLRKRMGETKRARNQGDSVSGRHLPWNCGIHTKREAGRLTEFVLTIRTTTMLEYSDKYQTDFPFHTDATFKVLQCGYPIITNGLTT